MDNCERCGKIISANYTYCRDCFYELGQPKNTVINKAHKCRRCGRMIRGKYNYCILCAKKNGYLKNEY